MGKGNIKEPIPHDLQVVPPVQFLGSPYRTHETIYAIGIPEEIEKDEGDMNDGCDIMVEGVERLRKILTLFIYASPNVKIIVQPYILLWIVSVKEKVIREEEHDYYIPLQDHGKQDDIDINTLTMEQYLAWVQDDIIPGVVKPNIRNDIKFETNSNFMRELRCKLFKGTDDEDAHEHVQRVLEIVDLFHFLGITYDAVMLRAFPITLKRPAWRWMNRLSVGLVTTWDLLEKVFIRYNDLLFKCSHHDLNRQQKVHIFHTGLDIPTRRVLDSKVFIHLMTPTQALISIQVMAEHSHTWYDEATTKERINNSLNNVNTKKPKENIHAIQASFKNYEGAHLTMECLLKKRTFV
nr:hypothetical protein [Tanacetum cinerariifolium]